VVNSVLWGNVFLVKKLLFLAQNLGYDFIIEMSFWPWPERHGSITKMVSNGVRLFLEHINQIENGLIAGGLLLQWPSQW